MRDGSDWLPENGVVVCVRRIQQRPSMPGSQTPAQYAAAGLHGLLSSIGWYLLSPST